MGGRQVDRSSRSHVTKDFATSEAKGIEGDTDVLEGQLLDNITLFSNQSSASGTEI